MSEASLVKALDQLATLHEGLLAVAKKKTDVLKELEAEALQEILKQEQKYVAAIQTVEQQRRDHARAILASHDRTDAEPTLSECQAVLTDPAMIDELETKKNTLILLMSDLAQQNTLNQQLTQQSLQFVNLSLGMLMPKEPEYGYNHPNTKKSEQQRASFFDSQT